MIYLIGHERLIALLVLCFGSCQTSAAFSFEAGGWHACRYYAIPTDICQNWENLLSAEDFETGCELPSGEAGFRKGEGVAFETCAYVYFLATVF